MSNAKELCILCKLDITPEQPHHQLSDTEGGGYVHDECFAHVEPYIKEIIAEALKLEHPVPAESESRSTTEVIH